MSASQVDCYSLVDSLAQLDINEGELRYRKELIDRILKPNLRACQELQLIAEDHKCFEPARALRSRQNVDDVAYDNHVSLLRGYHQFPLLLLQNPSPSHHQPFEEMKKCPTIDWISNALMEIGLSLDEVPIMDMCPMFSDDDLRAMDRDRVESVMEEAYKLAEDTLGILETRIVIVCQCRTKNGNQGFQNGLWGPAKNTAAQELCSSPEEANVKRAVVVRLGGRDPIWAAKGVHPGYVCYGPGSEKMLKDLIHDIYLPCVQKKREMQAASYERIVQATKQVIAAIDSRYHTQEEPLERMFDGLLSTLPEFRDALGTVASRLRTSNQAIYNGGNK